ncbi:Arm DNA-binding domain-containing protein [Salinivibrio kushneri]|uniref:Arm DNA-binding domain-containing protein n=1 Tax=Salinivibrio kushneri TaxID=1908198 RepID=UPI0009891831|nr:DUF3596 domain-containing protein [Salinivibrio kushneri]OOE71737.1 hypothetical protein BZG19_02155 [Salinivibrio kushneri]
MTPEGVEVRGTSIRIWFLYRGKRCKETLKGWKATPANIRKAGRLRAVIVSEISGGTFDYLARFPNSKKARELGNAASLSKSMTVAELFERWLKTKENQYTKTTLRSRKCAIKTCAKILGEEKLVKNVNYEDCLNLRSELFSGKTTYTLRRNTKGRSASTVNNYMTVCSEIWMFADMSGYVSANPFKKVKYLPIDESGPDPLEYEEFARLVSHRSISEQEANLWTVAVYTGLRHGELCALAWEDIDLELGLIKVSRNLTAADYFKLPKTRSSEREIALLQPAIDALKRQKAHTFMGAAEQIDVYLREPGKVRKEMCHFVFVTKDDKYYSKSGLAHIWDSCMRRSGIRRRTPYQTRHTYACWMLTEDANPSWIASQMGHKDSRMVMTTYGKFMPSQSGSQIDKLNSRFSAVPHRCPTSSREG